MTPNPLIIHLRSGDATSAIGHIAFECPNRKVITLVEYKTMEEQESREEELDREMKGTEEHVKEANGELLVLRRTLSGHKCANYEKQREFIHGVQSVAEFALYLCTKGVVVGLQTLAQEPHKVFFATKGGTTMLASPLPPFKLPQIIPQKNSLQMSSFLSFDKPSLKVPYRESRTFKEWKTIFQNEWESLLIPNELFKAHKVELQRKAVTPPTRGNMTPARITGGDPKG